MLSIYLILVDSVRRDGSYRRVLYLKLNHTTHSAQTLGFASILVV